MFESAELGHKIDKATYAREVPALRESLLNAQFDLAQSGRFPVIIVIGGVDGAGKGETVNLLNEWMDPRHIRTVAFPAPSDEERERPRMWRYWRALPPRGKIGILFGAWHTDPILARVLSRTTDAELDRSAQEVVRFERMLTDEGALILKFWFHLSKDRQRQRLRALEKDPKTRWRVTPVDWERFKSYDKFRRISERFLRQTSTANARWNVVEGMDAGYRSLTVGRILLDALRSRLDAPAPAAAAPAPPEVRLDAVNVLRELDLGKRIPAADYPLELERWQGKLNLLSRHPKFAKLAVVAVFEGADAGGKGGAIRRVTAALDARQYLGVAVAAPTEEERAQPYLWRFWRHFPRRGRFTIFDRSWYGRVLVERVEGLCAEADWRRAYAEINDLEDQLVRNQNVLVKFWLAVDQEEQLRRFEDRERTAFKHFKITAEDWRNREKWDAYEAAVCEMVDRTSTEIAPWTLVEANDKNFARIKVLRTLCRSIESALKPLKD